MPQSTLFGKLRLPNCPPTTTCLPDPLGFVATNLLLLGRSTSDARLPRIPYQYRRERSGLEHGVLAQRSGTVSLAAASKNRAGPEIVDPNLVPYHRTHDYPTDGSRRHRG